MSWRRTNIFRKRFTNEMPLQNIKEKSWSAHKILPKTSTFVWYQPFWLLTIFAVFFIYFVKNKKQKKTQWCKENQKWTAMIGHIRKKKHKSNQRKAALRQKTETCCTQPLNQLTNTSPAKGKYYNSGINKLVYTEGPVC